MQPSRIAICSAPLRSMEIAFSSGLSVLRRMATELAAPSYSPCLNLACSLALGLSWDCYGFGDIIVPGRRSRLSTEGVVSSSFRGCHSTGAGSQPRGEQLAAGITQTDADAAGRADPVVIQRHGLAATHHLFQRNQLGLFESRGNHTTVLPFVDESGAGGA